MSEPTVMQVDLPGISRLKSGKVREVFDLGDTLLFVATDRISAFDCIMPNGIPGKGEILTQISHFWFDRLVSVVPNHRVLGPGEPLPPRVQAAAAEASVSLDRRSMVVRKAKPLPIECVVRGYLAGSGWNEYRTSGRVCGVPLPPGLVESSELQEPIFTPATKADTGHDENISFERASEIVGADVAERVRSLSLKIYDAARDYARSRGILVADTKFEFGFWNDELLLIDEVLTPDSSRFWPAAAYQPGKAQPSFDKQFVRDYLLTLDWDKRPPAPRLPDEIVSLTREKYRDAYQRLTGQTL